MLEIKNGIGLGASMMKDNLFSIGNVSRITGTSVKTVRYYRDIGLLVAVRNELLNLLEQFEHTREGAEHDD